MPRHLQPSRRQSKSEHSFIIIVQESRYPQLGSLYLSSALAKHGIETHTIGSSATCAELDALISRVDPIAVGCSVMTAPEIVDFIRHSTHIQETYNRDRREIPVIWGGMHPTIVFDQTVKEPFIDLVVPGEAELSLQLVLTGLLDGRFPEQSFVAAQTPRDLDEYRPQWHGRDLTRYVFPESHSVHAEVEFVKQNIFYYLLTSRGCTYRCNFCWEVARTAALKAEARDGGGLVDLTWRSHSVEWIDRELDSLAERLEVSGVTMDGVGFWDDMIFGRGRPEHNDRAKAIFNSMRARAFGYLLEARANQLIATSDIWSQTGSRREADLYHFLKETGCMQVFVGTESGNQDTLNLIQKGTKLTDYLRLVEMSRDVGLPLRFSMIVGFPNESEKSINETLDFIERLEEEPYVSVSGPKLFTPYPGVPQFDAAAARGLRVPRSTLEWAYIDRYSDYREIFPWFTEDYSPHTLRRIDEFFEAVDKDKKHQVDEEFIRQLVRSH